MPFQKGHKLSVGIHSGRKSMREEVKKIKQQLGEEITNEALLKLARSKVFQQIEQSDAKDVAKDFALPITLKGITDKSQVEVIIPKPIYEGRAKV